MIEKKYTTLEKKIGYQFKNSELLVQALTHCSVPGYNNERLEFLGDSILNFIIGSIVFQKFPKAAEGDLTRMRSRLVRGETLAEIARYFSLGEYIRLGAGEQKSGGHERASILSDAVEAIIGAIYIDSDVEICKQHVLTWYESYLSELIVKDAPEKDAKTRLQEYLQSRGFPLPEYKVTAVHGAPHDQEFQVTCTTSLFKEAEVSTAKSRRKAEQLSAEKVLERLKNADRK